MLAQRHKRDHFFFVLNELKDFLTSAARHA
jgi:hypothetical protein